jgi:hypothetical protein
MRSSLRFLGVGAVALGVLGAGTAAAAPGGGAVSAPTSCLVSVPGFPDATGTGRIVITPNGDQRVSCQAELPDGTTPPAKTLKFTAGPCTIVVTTSGNVSSHC